MFDAQHPPFIGKGYSNEWKRYGLTGDELLEVLNLKWATDSCRNKAKYAKSQQKYKDNDLYIAYCKGKLGIEFYSCFLL